MVGMRNRILSLVIDRLGHTYTYQPNLDIDIIIIIYRILQFLLSMISEFASSLIIHVYIDSS